jgi:hypothetical protein
LATVVQLVRWAAAKGEEEGPSLIGLEEEPSLIGLEGEPSLIGLEEAMLVKRSKEQG